jgi:undecaprenyl-phosphate galactose phosphotransferase
VGAWLRKASLDELPQLLNVLRLEMSLVGPRPIVEAEAEKYGDDFAFYCETRPGITGLWQVSGRSDTTYAYRVQLDCWYVKNWTVWNDLAIIARTVPTVLTRRGAV